MFNRGFWRDDSAHPCVRFAGDARASRATSKRAVALTFVFAALLLGGVRRAYSHAILIEVSPAANSILAGPDVPIRLKFNVRIDASRSRVSLVTPGNLLQPLTIEKQISAEVLTAKAVGLMPGAYTIRWQVLAPDGHITRGEVHFTVRGT